MKYGFERDYTEALNVIAKEFNLNQQNTETLLTTDTKDELVDVIEQYLNKTFPED